MDNYIMTEHSARLLLAHMLLMAIEDHSRPTRRKDAQLFFDSMYLEWVADGLGLTSWRIRRRVAEGFD